MLKLLQYVVCEDRQDKYNKESVRKIFLIVKKNWITKYSKYITKRFSLLFIQVLPSKTCQSFYLSHLNSIQTEIKLDLS